MSIHFLAPNRKSEATRRGVAGRKAHGHVHVSESSDSSTTTALVFGAHLDEEWLRATLGGLRVQQGDTLLIDCSKMETYALSIILI